MSGAAEIERRLDAVRRRVDAAARRSGRAPESVALVGVAKRQAPERVLAALRAGLRCVGENYVQEALEKREELRAALEGLGSPPPHWHFIGQLQRNKARDAVAGFDVVESLDRESLGAELERRAASARKQLDVLLQLDLSDEPGKGGVAPAAAPALLEASRGWPHLRVVGLMTVPAPADDPERSRPAFARLRGLAEELRGLPGGAGLRELSMGMSADFEVAIEEGATIVRVGTAIFGARDAGGE